MSVFKHLTFEEPYVAQPSLEGLWDNIVSLFSSKEFSYRDLDGILEFFKKIEQKGCTFKQEPIKPNKHIGIFIEKDKLLPLLISALEKEYRFLQSTLSSSDDMQYSKLVETVYEEAMKAKSEKELFTIGKKHLTKLKRTPVSKLRSHVFVTVPGNAFIEHDGKPNPYFFDYYVKQNAESQTEILPCKKEEFNKLHGLLKDYIQLSQSAVNKKQHLREYSYKELSKIWNEFYTEDGVYSWSDYMCEYNKNYSPYSTDLILRVSSEIIEATCYWVYKSLTDYKDF